MGHQLSAVICGHLRMKESVRARDGRAAARPL